MKIQNDYRPVGCQECADGSLLGFDFTMAFQPIVNTTTRQIFAYEALARGLNNEPAGVVFEQLNQDNLYRFDQTCRTKAIQLAAELGMTTMLSINFMPNAIYRPELCIRTTLNAADMYGFPLENIIFEFTENEQMDDIPHLKSIVDYYHECGFKTATDDFGAGYAGLNLLSEIQTDIIKLDMAMIRGIENDNVRQAIVKGVVQICNQLDITLVAEGIETYHEWQVLQSFGIELFQGYYFAKPAFRSLTTIPDYVYQAPST